jgi:hypothetical protein
VKRRAVDELVLLLSTNDTTHQQASPLRGKREDHSS